MTATTDPMQLADDALRLLGASIAPAECHGTLIGLLCAKGHVDKEAWLAAVLPEQISGGGQAADALRVLDGMCTDAQRQLSDPLLEFHPLLPDDDDLGTRVEALGEWCEGFLMGLSLGGIQELDKLPGDAREALSDLVQIARITGYALDDSEEDEGAYEELVEYVRTAVLLINEELNPIKAPPQGGTLLH